MLGTVAVALVLVIGLWDWNWFRPLVAAQASAALGRSVTLKHFDLKPGWRSVAIADGVTVANPEGMTGDAPFATIDRLTVAVDVWRYLRDRQIVVPRIVFDRPVVAAVQREGQPGGQPGGQTGGQKANWLFPALIEGTPSSAPSPLLGDLEINDGHATVVAPALKSDFAVDIATTDPDASGARHLKAEANGTYAGQKISGQALAGALLSLREATQPYPIDLKVQNGPTKVSLTGTVTNPMNFAGADLKLSLSGPDMGLLTPLLGIPLPKTPPYSVSGDLDYTAANIVFRGMQGRVGASDLSGKISGDPHRTPRPLVEADLRSKSVDLADLGGFIGSQPGRMSTPNQTPEQKQALAQAEASPQLLPTKPIDLPTLRMADIRLAYDGARIIGKGVPFDRIATKMTIDDGRIHLEPLALGVGKGQITGTIDLAPLSDKQIKLDADMGVQRVDLHRLMEAAGVTNASGTIGGRAKIVSTGNSVATFAGNGDGSVQLVMAGGGNFSALLLNLSGLQFGNALLSALGIPRTDEIRCFVGDWGLRQGLLSTRTLVLETSNNVVSGSGDVNLRNETLDYRVKTEAKHFSIGTLPTPFAITGKFKDPSIKPDALPLAARAGAAVGLGLLFAPAALLPTIQFGVGEDETRCSGVVRK